MSLKKKWAGFGIAALCFGYFASYVPYAMMTKMLTDGLFSGMDGGGFSGFTILPVSVFASFVAMYVFLSLSGWWRFAQHKSIFGFSIPFPRAITFLSGVCTAGVIMTTTLAYTFGGISIVFAMLLMRGGVLAIAPLIDLIAVKRKRKIYWPSWVAAGLSFGALLTAFFGKSSTAMTFVAAVDIVFYLGSYFLRLFIMSNHAKSNCLDEKKAYFTEEQMVANPVLLGALLIVGLYGSSMDAGSMSAQIWAGFTEFPQSGYFWHCFWIGIFSYGNGMFGSLIFLDRRENTFTVPANRVSSIISGVVATILLAVFFGQKYPGNDQIIGVALILGAIFFLAYRQVVEKRKTRSVVDSAMDGEKQASIAA